MSKPTKAEMLQAREDVLKELGVVRHHLRNSGPAVGLSFTRIETFVAVAMRVFAKTNTSKLRSETTNVELAARLSGRVVFDLD